MASTTFSFEVFGPVVVRENLGSNNEFDDVVGGTNGSKHNHSREEYWRDSSFMETLNSDFGLYQDNLLESDLVFAKFQQQDKQEEYPLPADDLLDDLNFEAGSPTLQTCLKEIANLGSELSGVQHGKDKKEKQHPFWLASLELLKSYEHRWKKLDGDKFIKPSSNTTLNRLADPSLSTEEIIRLAGVKFIQTTSSVGDLPSTFIHPYGSSFSGLSDQDMKDAQLVELLLFAAEKVHYQEFHRASKLLNQCNCLCSNKGNPIQRVVFYFAEALRERIDRGSGRIAVNACGKRQKPDPHAQMTNPTRSKIACHQELPFVQVAQFAGVQAIVESVDDAKKVHVIDLNIGSGAQWTILMQALVLCYDCQIELLKITAVGTSSKNRIDETGKRLINFAQSMSLPFTFKSVVVGDVLDLKHELFEIDTEEAVFVYSQYFLRTLIPQPNRLESLMKVIRKTNPRVMVVAEVEANLNSPNFVHRFIESLFYYGACFDCLEASMSREDFNRRIIESIYFGDAVKNILASEGEERTVRHVKIDVWRAYFGRFGMIEAELSSSSLYHANLVMEKFGCGRFCTFDMNGKCLIVGWKGTPVQSLSVLKFT
ncbi:DELLA protein GAI-like [Rhodamnia argentea]|uniref:DELLA protein GAI-like n=1 Tax=Rhodamnia argentea TaxID=178133 RepID=A0A8B8Q0B9_9MYRT|nr:DELLA protein GAI-like [Rhodamnia argentea]